MPHAGSGKVAGTAEVGDVRTGEIGGLFRRETSDRLVGRFSEAPLRWPTLDVDDDAADGARILVVDDDATSAPCSAGRLTTEGYSVDEAADGPAAWRRWEPSRPTWSSWTS